MDDTSSFLLYRKGPSEPIHIQKKYLKKKDANAHEWILKIGTKGQKHMLDIAKCEFPAED